MSGQKLPSVKREDGDIMVSRTIRTPSASMLITGTLTEADRIYRLTLRSLLQNGYSSTHLTSLEHALPGDPEPPAPPTDQQQDIDRLVDEGMELLRANVELQSTVTHKQQEIDRLEGKVITLETLLNNVTGRNG